MLVGSNVEFISFIVGRHMIRALKHHMLLCGLFADQDILNEFPPMLGVRQVTG